MSSDKNELVLETLQDQVEIELSSDNIDISQPPESADAKLSVEEQAKAMGWNPKGPKSAEEWVRSAPLYDEIHRYRRETKDLKSTIDAMKSHMDKQVEYGRQQALSELEFKRQEAIALGDVNKVYDLEDQIRTQNQLDEPPIDRTKTPEAQSAITSFAQKHSTWINETSSEAQAMKVMAQMKDNELAAMNLAPEVHLELVEAELRKAFPHRFVNTNTYKAGATIESDRKTSGRGKQSIKLSDLNDEQRACYNYFTRHNVMKGEDYIKQLVDMGEIKGK